LIKIQIPLHDNIWYPCWHPSMATPRQPSPLEDFLQPLAVDVRTCHSLARSLSDTFTRLAKESQEQFLPTPISDSILRPEGDAVGR